MPNAGEEWTCPRCERSFIAEYDAQRARSGSFTEELPDGSVKTHEPLLCEDCHREVVRS